MQITSKGQFFKFLRSRPLENIDAIEMIETYLRKKRGYIFRMPAKKESVILLLSGGLDSVTSWAILMQNYGLNVYPLTFDRCEKRRKREKESVNFFTNYYKKRFPNFFHNPIEIKLDFKKIDIPIETAPQLLHPEIRMKYFKSETGEIDVNVSLGSFVLLSYYARMYAEHLYLTKNIKVKTIFCSVNSDDGLLVPWQTYTALRSIMLNLCLTSNDFEWQFSSSVLESETDRYFDKSDIIKWAYQNSIPVEKTWSCYRMGVYQCGGSDCQACRHRRYAYRRAKIVDKTVYKSLAEQSLFGRIKSFFRPIRPL